MKGFKRCNNGHFFKEDMAECPYCPKPESAAPATDSSFGEKTQISGNVVSNDNNKTQIFGSTENSGNKTQIFGSGGNENNPPKRDLNKTFIQGMEVSESGEIKQGEELRANRMITGWIISYTLDPMGMDFRIYEGNNSIGRDAGNTITIIGDPGVSGKHVTLLCKKGKFYIKDEMAANGTFINGNEIEIGKPEEVKDGDEIRLGPKTIFRFKSAI